jgi:hypothetical protein
VTAIEGSWKILLMFNKKSLYNTTHTYLYYTNCKRVHQDTKDAVSCVKFLKCEIIFCNKYQLLFEAARRTWQRYPLKMKYPPKSQWAHWDTCTNLLRARRLPMPFMSYVMVRAVQCGCLYSTCELKISRRSWNLMVPPLSARSGQ